MRVGIEIGGTFTDLVAIGPRGLITAKVPSTPEEPEAAVFEALDRIDTPISAIDTLIHGSTVATNALIERRGARTALVVTAGFRDLLELQREHKSRNYDLRYARTRPLVAREHVLEAHERLDAQGRIVEPLDEARLQQDLSQLLAHSAPDALAVCLIHACANSAHEIRVRDIARGLAPGLKVSISSEVLPELREYERASTTVMNAYLAPIVEGYLDRLQNGLEARGFRGRFHLMQSNGGMLTAERSRQHAVRMLLSGPAAGVTGALMAGRASGFSNLITLDMGGTSTDVSLIAQGSPAITTARHVDRLPILAPMLDITAIGAGGGSVIGFDPAGTIQVGPRSAGARPGPACYGRGGMEPTLTDAWLVMGLIRPDQFLGGAMPLDRGAAIRTLTPIADRLGLGLLQAAEGVFHLACANMLQAVRQISIERGHDPRDYALLAYGGAGPLHACVLAESLQSAAVIVPRHPGLNSAMGLAVAEFRMDYVRSRILPVGPEADQAIAEVFASLRDEAHRDLHALGEPEGARVEYAVDLRYQGQGYELSIEAEPFGPTGAAGSEAFREVLLQRFHVLHERRLGHSFPTQTVRAVHWRASLRIAQPPVGHPAIVHPGQPTGRPTERGVVHWGGESVACAYVDRSALSPGDSLIGAAVIEEPSASTFVPPGWIMEVDPAGALIIRKAAAGRSSSL
jgi:N-methylhydantoinase A